jgi:hypothetical protein
MTNTMFQEYISLIRVQADIEKKIADLKAGIIDIVGAGNKEEYDGVTFSVTKGGEARTVFGEYTIAFHKDVFDTLDEEVKANICETGVVSLDAKTVKATAPMLRVTGLK